ncbi:hypothetical protein EIN_316820 [Entamoeba invadens IP1]|nr:hypothetical protein EIN_316820 [Entamoeba invadens IP1]ELP86963.1 hypothetical protein EIN_316820 [Entamoeba invadens IP1]|eukprot:XP_004253734.1 hypothetical protein EIN_316820 [Entamoeba invadens IP1]
MYNATRTFHPSQYPHSASQALPEFDVSGVLLNEPLFVISPKKVYIHKIYVAYKERKGGVVSVMVSFTGELLESGVDGTLEEMIDRWLCFIQQTTQKEWEVTFCKVGEIGSSELGKMNGYLDDIRKNFKGVVKSVFLSDIEVYPSMVMSEEEYELLDGKKSFYKVDDQRTATREMKGENRATYYSLLPGCGDVGCKVGGYTVNLYDPDNTELHRMMQQYHDLSFLNSDPVDGRRWSILPRHVHILQKIDLRMDIVDLCD